MMRLIYANTLPALVEALIDNTAAERRAQGRSPLERALVLREDRSTGAYLRLALARQGGIAAREQLLPLHRFITARVEAASGRRAATKDRIERGLLRLFSQLKHSPDPELSEVQVYLQASGPEEGPRAAQLAAELARVFDGYTSTRPDQLSAWRRDAPTEPGSVERWQAHLWRRLCAEAGLSSVYELLTGLPARALSLPADLHLFDPSPLGLSTQSVLSKLAEGCQLYVYAQNPCLEFWEDLQAGWTPAAALPPRAEVAEADAARDEEALYLDLDQPSDPPLLRLWGRPRRESIRSLNQLSGCDFEPRFTAPASRQALGRLQADVLLRAPEREQPAGPADDSVRVWGLKSPAHEAERIAEEIWRRIEAPPPPGRPPLCFADFAVALSGRESAKYRTRLAAAFEAHHRIPCGFLEVPLFESSRVMDAVSLLLDLPGSRYTRQELLSLLIHPNLFPAGLDATPEEWLRWCEALQVFHGASQADHAGSYLDRDLYNWDQGLLRLTLGAFMGEDAPIFRRPPPTDAHDAPPRPPTATAGPHTGGPPTRVAPSADAGAPATAGARGLPASPVPSNADTPPPGGAAPRPHPRAPSGSNAGACSPGGGALPATTSAARPPSHRTSSGSGGGGVPQGEAATKAAGSRPGRSYLPLGLPADRLESAAALLRLARDLLADARFAATQRLSLSGWCALIGQWIHVYLWAEPGSEDERDLLFCHDALEELGEEARQDPGDAEALLPFSAGSALILDRLRRARRDRGPPLVEGVVIAPLNRIASLPFSVVFLPGLGEGRFPAPERSSQLDLRRLKRRAGEVSPRERDLDAFLARLLHTQDAVILSYVAEHPASPEPLEPSSSLSLLSQLLNRGYLGEAAPAPDHNSQAVLHSPAQAPGGATDPAQPQDQAPQAGQHMPPPRAGAEPPSAPQRPADQAQPAGHDLQTNPTDPDPRTGPPSGPQRPTDHPSLAEAAPRAPAAQQTMSGGMAADAPAPAASGPNDAPPAPEAAAAASKPTRPPTRSAPGAQLSLFGPRPAQPPRDAAPDPTAVSAAAHAPEDGDKRTRQTGAPPPDAPHPDPTAAPPTAPGADHPAPEPHAPTGDDRQIRGKSDGRQTQFVASRRSRDLQPPVAACGDVIGIDAPPPDVATRRPAAGLTPDSAVNDGGGLGRRGAGDTGRERWAAPVTQRRLRTEALRAELARHSPDRLPQLDELRRRLPAEEWTTLAHWLRLPELQARPPKLSGTLPYRLLKRFLVDPAAAWAEHVLGWRQEPEDLLSVEHERFELPRLPTLSLLEQVLLTSLHPESPPLGALYTSQSERLRVAGALPAGVFGQAQEAQHLQTVQGWATALSASTAGASLRLDRLRFGSSSGEHAGERQPQPALRLSIPGESPLELRGRTELLLPGTRGSVRLLDKRCPTDRKAQREELAGFLDQALRAAAGEHFEHPYEAHLLYKDGGHRAISFRPMTPEEARAYLTSLATQLRGEPHAYRLSMNELLRVHAGRPPGHRKTRQDQLRGPLQRLPAATEDQLKELLRDRYAPFFDRRQERRRI